MPRTVALVTRAGFRIVNVDCTVLADKPKIAPHRAAMRARIAAILELPEGAVGVKATTLEGLLPGAIACQAACVVEAAR